MKCVPVTDPALIEQLKAMGCRAFLGVDGSSYGRCDIRMNEVGELFLLEVNPNCGVFYPPEAMGSADLALTHDVRGHAHFVDAIFRAALRKQRTTRKVWQVVLNPDQSYGMYATRPIGTGELIEALEGRAQRLVSKSQVTAQWDAQAQAWFRQYAIPVTDELYLLWSQDPTEWLPLTHGCDPNAWFDGLNLVARRAIAPNEPIRVDYATFRNEVMADFVCTCGAATCRSTIHGSDYREAFVARYGTHVSDYVRNKRQGL